MDGNFFLFILGSKILSIIILKEESLDNVHGLYDYGHHQIVLNLFSPLNTDNRHHLDTPHSFKSPPLFSSPSTPDKGKLTISFPQIPYIIASSPTVSTVSPEIELTPQIVFFFFNFLKKKL
jgi:hypothetical protein